MPAYIGDGRGQPGIEGRQAAVETGDLTPQEPADGEQNADREDSPIRETSLSPRLGLIRFGGHLPRGEYDVDHDGHAGQADAAELHG